MGGDKDPNRSVELSALSAVTMILHATKHSHTAVHGVLLGSFVGDTVKVSQAVPVCHGAPTQPILETALALIKTADEDGVVVGWYVSPLLETDDRPGPAALKIVSGLATSDDKKKEPALIVLRNKELDKILLDKERSLEDTLQALGKDFGQQWLQPTKTSFANEETIRDAFKKALQNDVSVTDLVDHFDMDAKKSRWFPDDSMKQLFK